MVGLTGGIGSGKSTVAGSCSAGAGAVVIDADAIARGGGRDRARPRSPRSSSGSAPSILGPTARSTGPRSPQRRSSTTRPARSSRRSPTRRSARSSSRRIAAAPADAIVVHDVPLLVESTRGMRLRRGDRGGGAARSVRLARLEARGMSARRRRTAHGVAGLRRGAPGRGDLGGRQLRRPRGTSNARSTRSGPSCRTREQQLRRPERRGTCPERRSCRHPLSYPVCTLAHARIRPGDRSRAGGGPAGGDRGTGRGHRAGRQVPDAARHHRVGQELHDRQRDREGRAARRWCSRRTSRSRRSWRRSSASCSRSNRVEYFVSYYDYYQPEAYIPSTDTYIEKDSLDQRRDRPAAPLGHERAAHPPRRDHRRVGVGDLRPRLARDVREAAADARARARSATSAASCAGSSSCSTSATTSRSPATSSGCGATRSRSSRRTRSARCASSCSATRSSASASVDPLTGEVVEELDSARAVPRVALRHRRGAAAAGDRAASRPSSSSGSPSSKARASCSRRSGCACAPPTTSRCCARSAAAPGVENYSMHLDGRVRQPAALHAARLLPRRLARASSTSRTSRSRSCTASSRATGRARRRSSSTASGCRRRWTTGRCGSRSSSSA